MPGAAVRAAHLVADLHVARHLTAAALLGVRARLLVPADAVRSQRTRAHRVMRDTAALAAGRAFDGGQIPAVPAWAGEAIRLMRQRQAHGAIVAPLVTDEVRRDCPSCPARGYPCAAAAWACVRGRPRLFAGATFAPGIFETLIVSSRPSAWAAASS